MMNIPPKIRILLVDDIDEFRDSFIYRNESDEFEISADKSLEQAEQRLKADFYKYDFIILDARGHITAGMGDQEGQEGHVYIGIEKVKELSRLHGKSLPYCVYTGQTGSLEALKQMHVPVFLKTEDDAAMFDYIRSQHRHQPEATFRLKHPEIALIFERGWLSRENERELISLFSKNETNSLDQLKLKAGRIRPMMEAVYNKLATIDRTLVPTRIRPNDELALSSAIWTVAGKPTKDFQPSNPAMHKHLFETVSALQKSVSTSIMHGYVHPISRYTLASYTNTLADLLLWFSDFMQKRA